MRSTPAFPCLPGFNFDHKIGKTNFHRSVLFEKIHEGVHYLAERPIIAKKHDEYPSLYPYMNDQKIPAWIAYDGQRLMFQGYFQETVQERWQTSQQIRRVIISFFLEDGTIKIAEPPICNSGLEQGVLVRRQRIPMPGPAKYRFFDVIDLNIGKEPEIFGRVYKIIDCDKFTRIFLNRMGIAVPDPIQCPGDSYMQRRNVPMFPKKPNRKVDTLKKFLKYDRKILKFYGYWDDRESEYGVIHHLELLYYLADDTIEIKEILPKNLGRGSNSSMFLKRMQIPKFFAAIDSIGSNEPFTVLNVMGDDSRGAHSYFIPDALNTGKTTREFYKDNDFTIGTRINVFGREIIITDLDLSTRDYYRTKYGIEEFEPLEKPKASCHCFNTSEQYNKPPPYNGYGSYDDSLGNCFSIVPKPPKIDYVRFAEFDKQGYDSKVLSFRGKMICKNSDNCNRNFVIRIFLMDNTISVFEGASRNTGFTSCLFQKRMQVPLPGQDIYSSEKPKNYEPHDFYIGTHVNLCGFEFQITYADDYTLRYMELHCDKFPKANITLIMSKIREALKPVYGQFLEEYCPMISADGIRIMPYDKLKEALNKYLMNNSIVEHEIITIARRYALQRNQERNNTRDYLRSLIHAELNRFLWNDLDRLAEDINHWDTSQTGYLLPNQVYTLLRGSRLPINSELLHCLLNHLRRNAEGKIDCHDLLEFMNVKINPVSPIAPIPLKALHSLNSNDNINYPALNWHNFIEDLNIKEDNPASAATDS